MPMEKRNLAEEFEVLANDREAPVSAVDYGRAMSHGRRTLLLRRSAGGLTGVVTLVLAATLTGMLPFPGSGGEGEPTVAAPTPAPSPPAHAADPMTVDVEFGWAPSNLTLTGYNSGHGDTTIAASSPEPATGSDQSESVSLTVSNEPDHQDNPGTATQVGTLNGYPVRYSVEQYQLTASRQNTATADPSTCKAGPAHPTPTLAQEGIYAEGDASLLWHTASGQLATINYVYVNQPIPDAPTLLHIAETAAFVPTTITMPFSITGVTPLARTFETAQGKESTQSPVDTILVYTVGRTQVVITVDPPADMVAQVCAHSKSGVAANKVINGLHFYVSELSTDGPDAPLDMSKTGTPQAILQRITSYGPNPDNWTKHVLAQ